MTDQVELLAAIDARLTAMQTELQATMRTELQAELAPVKTRLDAVEAELARKPSLEEVRAELASKPSLEEVRAELASKPSLEEVRAELQNSLRPLKVQLDGMPLLHRNLVTTQQEVRMLAAAFNDFARENVTKGEIETLHTEINRVQTEYTALAVRMETAERHIRELQSTRDED